MRVRELGTRPAPVTMREILSQLVRGHGPAIFVRRREIPYWQERRWTRNGRTYTGSYQTPHAAFQGRIEEGWSGHLDFFLRHPSREIEQGGHWSCFVPRGDGWYLVHMARRPKDVSSGIMTIERLITEAYR